MIPVLVLAVVGAGAPCQDLPLLPGTTWTYRVQVSWTVEGSSTVRDTTMVWKTKVLASLRRDTTIVATVENWPTAAAWWEPKQAADTTLLACVGNRLYHLTRKQTASGAGTSPPEASGPLEPSINDLLLVFPLHEGMLYGQDPPDRTDSYYGWYVEQADPMPPSLKRLGADGGDSLYTLAYRTYPDHQIIEFAPGLGIARYIYAHHGTVATADVQLIGVHIAH